MQRQIGAAVAIAAVLLLCNLLLGTSLQSTRSRTVPNAVLSDGMAPTGSVEKAMAIALEEINYLEGEGYALTSTGVVVYERLWTGFYAAFGECVTGTANVSATWSPDLIRKTTAHEAHHALAKEAGLSYSSEDDADRDADMFSACFGSPGAQYWAREIQGIRPSQTECDNLKERLIAGAN